MDEESLIKATQDGDKKAFEKMLIPYKPKLQSFLTRMCNNPTTAEDMLQETMLSVYSNISTFQGASKFSTWLFKIATNNCRMLKRQKSESEEPIEDHHEDSHSTSPFEKIENDVVLQEYLMQIPPIYRAAVILSEIEGLPAKEIAEMFDITLENAKARIQRGRQMLVKLTAGS